MMLRSSSTPVLGSLLSSFSETPNHHNSDPYATVKHTPNTVHQKLSFHHSGSLNYTLFSINSSPISPSISDFSVSSGNGFRRAQSEGNLEGLIASDPCKSDDEFTSSKPPRKFISRRTNCPHLETIPSFSSHHARNRYENVIDSEDNEEVEEEEEEEEEDEGLERGESGEINGGFFENSIRGEEKHMGLRNRALNLDEEIRLLVKEHSSPEMYLARGLGVDSFDMGFGGGDHHNNGGGGGGSGGGGGGGGEGNQPGVEEHYKRLVEENPGNPLCLRNYGQFLYESKGDLKRAEEYYSRAILADPKDGDVLSQYAKLVWELHRDQDRALSYFERAVHAAPEDNHVHAAYASFLWETEEAEDGDDLCVLPSHFQNGAMASATA